MRYQFICKECRQPLAIDVWVTRAKENLAGDVVKRLPTQKGSKILVDEIVGIQYSIR